MITTIRKGLQFVGQTQVSLSFAARARSIQNAAERNVENADAAERVERRARVRAELKGEVEQLVMRGAWHQALKPQDSLVTMMEADYGSGHVETSNELKVLATVCVVCLLLLLLLLFFK